MENHKIRYKICRKLIALPLLFSIGIVHASNLSFTDSTTMKPLTGLQPDQQTGPISPVDPIGPGGPIGPIVPIDPIEPFDPKDPVDPEDEEVTSSYKVGTPKGTFSVSSAGAATYNVAIEAPNGGGLEPGIGVAYSSQSGNGLAGYGFNITGISCITRGNRDLFHDNTISGTTFGLGDVFYLEGKD